MFGLHKTSKPALILAGLGNPEKKYAYTRHNAGFLFLSAIGKRFGIRIKKKQFDSFTGIWHEKGKDILLMEPLTYMNLSGIAVHSAIRKYKLTPHDMIIVHDDMDIPVGRAKFHYNRSSAGHRGIESIIEKTGTKEFYRIRIGIGKPSGYGDPAEYVLSEFSTDELGMLNNMFDTIIENLMLFINGDRQKAMEHVNNIKGI